jgi:hypothetical protein
MPPTHGDLHPASASHKVASNTNGTQQTSHAYQATPEPGSTYITYSYKKERTYRTRAREETGVVPLVSLPPCLRSANPDQQKDMLVALRRVPPQHQQEVLDELQARSQSGTVRNVVAYFFGLIKRVLADEFRLWAGRRQAQSANPPQQAMPRSVGSTQPEQPWQQAVSKPASPEAARFHIALAREILKKPVNAGDLAAHVMRSKGWRPGPA